MQQEKQNQEQNASATKGGGAYEHQQGTDFYFLEKGEKPPGMTYRIGLDGKFYDVRDEDGLHPL